jgi:hypothetical protein
MTEPVYKHLMRFNFNLEYEAYLLQNTTLVGVEVGRQRIVNVQVLTLVIPKVWFSFPRQFCEKSTHQA